MIRTIALLAGLMLTHCALAQDLEIHKNGLIYNESTMKQLRCIVDSLDLNYRSCDPDRCYAGPAIARGYHVELRQSYFKRHPDPTGSLSLEAFQQRYPKAKVSEVIRISSSTWENHEGMSITSFRTVPGDLDGYTLIQLPAENAPERCEIEAGYWLENEEKKGDFEAIYFESGFNAQPLPLEYSQMVLYAHCLLDTTTAIFHPDATQGRYWADEEPTGRANTPTLDKAELMMAKGGGYWEHPLSSKKRKDIDFWAQFEPFACKAAEEAIATRTASEVAEMLAYKFCSAEQALELKRLRKVYGTCSMDDSPRVHAQQIALLAAESFTWEVFLRAHLDIMNDNFSRMSDGSYAWARRGTYIKELEELDINVVDLLLGITLRIDNAPEHHYYSNVGRIGRALTESDQRKEAEEKMLQMIYDESLDGFNRRIVYNTFVSYAYQLPEKEETAREALLAQAEQALQSLPAHYRVAED